MPPPDLKQPFPVDCQRALTTDQLETPVAALARRRQGGSRPAIYQPPAASG